MANQDDPNVAAIEAHLARRKPVATAVKLEIAPDEVDVVTLFFALGTQWRWLSVAMSGVTVRVGIDYGAISATALLCSITVTPHLFADIRVMEAAALAVANVS